MSETATMEPENINEVFGEDGPVLDRDIIIEPVTSDVPEGGIASNSAISAYDAKFVADCKAIATHAERALDSVEGFASILRAGEESWNLLLKEKARLGEAYKRSDSIKLITDVMATVSRLARTSIRPNDWIRVYHTMLIYTGATKMREMHADQRRNLSYSTVLIASRLVDQTDAGYFVPKENVDLFRGIMDSHHKGLPDRLYAKALREAIDSHEKDVANRKEAARKANLDPEKVDAEERANQLKVFRKINNARTRAVEKLIENLSDTGLTDKEATARLLSDYNAIPKSYNNAPLAIPDLAAKMSPQDAILLVEELARSGRSEVLAVLAKQCMKIARANAERQRIDGAAEKEGLAIVA